jgi:hypothetical protein
VVGQKLKGVGIRSALSLLATELGTHEGSFRKLRAVSFIAAKLVEKAYPNLFA